MLKANDLEGMVRMYTSDAVLMPPSHEVVAGSDALRSWFREMLDRFEIVDYAITQDELVVAGDWAYRRGTFAWKLRAKSDGAITEPGSKFLQIWQRVDATATWRVARGIWNSNA